MFKKEFKNHVAVNGKGKSAISIVETYIDLFNNGYDLTVAEICEYLRCTSSYFLNNLKDEIKHIRVNTVVREKAFFYYNIGMIDIEDYKYLFLKRLLYNREDFNRFLLEKCTKELKYKRLTLKELGIEIGSYESSTKLLKKLNNKSIEIYGVPKDVVIKPLKLLPSKLLSFKDLKQHYGFKYDVELYRFLAKYGINKIKLFNFVRYDENDLNKDAILINYKAYKRLGFNKIKDELLKGVIKDN